MPRALVVKLGAIGDVVMAIPGVHALYLRGLEIDWVCGPAVAPILACYPWIKTIVVDEQAILKGNPGARLGAIASLWRRLIGVRYELCATLYFDARYKMLTLPVRARRRVMLSRTERGQRLLPSRHHTDEFARILLNEEDTFRPMSLGPVAPDSLPGSPLPGKQARVRVALVPGGASNMMRQQTLRRWPIESYVSLANSMLRRGYEVVLIGGPDDAWVRPSFAGLTVFDAVGTMGLAEVVSVFQTCDLVVSHDTGPMHLAGLSSAALIAIFGPTDPGCFLPRKEGVRGLWGGEGFACRPCYDGVEFAPCHNNGCVQEITPAMVMAQADSLLAERTSGNISAHRIVVPSQVAWHD